MNSESRVLTETIMPSYRTTKLRGGDLTPGCDVLQNSETREQYVVPGARFCKPGVTQAVCGGVSDPKD